MTDGRPPIPERALALWRDLTGDPETGTPGTRKVVRGSRGLGPEGWTAVLRLGNSWVIETGEADASTLAALLDLDDPADPEQVDAVVPIGESIGPAELAYLPEGSRPEIDAAEARAGSHGVVDLDVTIVEVARRALATWLDTLPPEDVAESSVNGMDRVLVADVAGQHVAAAGHRTWPEGVAHVGLLVAPTARGRGLGHLLGAAATERALVHGLVPQWRATTTNRASRAIASRIGYVEFGRQFGFTVERGGNTEGR
jgi:GNAT superfamily N-acetyltransferase